MIKKVFSLVFFVSISIIVVSFATPSLSTAETIDLKFSHAFPPMHLLQRKVFEPWAQKISEQTDGRVKVSFFPGGALGKPFDQYKLAEVGVADIVYIGLLFSPGRFPMTTVFELPFMTPSAQITSEAMWKTYEKYPQVQKEYAKYKVLGLFCHTAGHFHTSKKAIRGIDDFKGMKIRTASPSVTDALKIFRAIPVEMPITETYTALERGVVDGTVVPFEGLKTFKLEELVKNTTITDFYTVTMACLMNKKKYDSLPDDIKAVIDKNSGIVMSSWCGKTYDTAEAHIKEMILSKGKIEVITLPDLDMQKLHDLVLPMREAWVKDMADRGLDGKPVLEGALDFLGIK